jgi:hypothetical protein
MKFWHFTNSKEVFDHDWSVSISVLPPSSMDHIVYAFGAGAPVDSGVRASVKVRSQRELPDVIVTGEGILAKLEICELIHNAFGSATQIIPVDTESEFLSGRACINITQHFKCLDFARSDVVMHPGDPEMVMAIKKLCIKSHSVPTDKSMFRVSEFRPMVLVDELAKQMLQDCGIAPTYFSDLLLKAYNADQGN